MQTAASAPLAPIELPSPLPATTIEPVRTAADRDRFIKLPFKIYAGDPYFVPPMIVERRDFLDPRKNPFLAHAELSLYLAIQNGEVVGRIAAINDPHYNQFHNTETGFFGMIECINDRNVARALIDTASDWVERKGMKQLLGPVNLSFNHDCGVLIDGFNSPAAMMLAYNPPYYQSLMEACGLQKAQDLWSYHLSTAAPPPERVVRIAEQIRKQGDVRVRSLRMNELHEEIRRLKSVYNAMLERSWGFVPMSDEEFDSIAARLRPLVQIRPELFLIVEVKDEPVAFSITLPDSNIAIKAAGGSLTRYGLPIGLAKLFWAARKIDRLRVLLLGIKPGYRRRGLDAVLYLETMHAARRLGYTEAEIGWVAEDHDLIIHGVEAMGARRFKTYRLYQRVFERSPSTPFPAQFAPGNGGEG